MLEYSSNGTATFCQPYLQSSVLWRQLQKYSMHDSIQPEMVGQYACEAVMECLGLPYEAHKANLQWLKSRTLAALRDANIAFDIGAWQSASFVARMAFSPRTPDSSGFSASQQAAEWRDRRVQELETSVANAFRALADCVDVAAFDNNVRVWGMLSWIYAPRGIRDINLTSANRWKIAAECNEQCDPALPLHKFLKLCSAIYKHSQAGNCSNSAYSTHAADVNLWHLAGRNEVQDLIWKLTRSGHVQQHARFIQHFQTERVTHVYPYQQFTTNSIAEELLHTVALRGRTDVLEHIFNTGVLSGHTGLLNAVLTGAIEGDTVVTVQWLNQHELLHAKFRQQLHVSNRKIMAYFNACDQTNPAAQH
jgi:hypothetical protein